MFVCLLVCWFVCFLSATRHLSTLRRCLRVAERAGTVVAGGPARARAQVCTARARGRKHAQLARARARMPYNFSTKISYADTFQKQNRTRALVEADLGQLVYTYKRVVCVCWFVCLLFIGHTTFVHFAALPPSGREQEPSSRAAPPAARACMHSESMRARMPYNFSTRKSLR